MKILFYDTKPYDRHGFEALLPSYPQISMDFIDADLTVHTARLAQGYDAVCAFVNADLGRSVLASSIWSACAPFCSAAPALTASICTPPTSSA